MDAEKKILELLQLEAVPTTVLLVCVGQTSLQH